MSRKALHIVSWLLLAAYMPLIVASVMHTHHPAAVQCQECAAHVAHPVHLDSSVLQVHDCMLCHLLTIFYYVTSAAFAMVLTYLHARRHTGVQARLASCQEGLPALRAPPCYRIG